MKASIYIGLRAIGWNITENNQIIDRGIKRVHVEFDNYYEYIAGNPVTLRINRRQKRQARRNRSRRLSRRNNLKYFLRKRDIFSPKSRTRNERLRLRVKGLHQSLSSEELYHVLLDLYKRRGYKSLRGVSDNDNSDYLQTIAMHEENRKKFKSIADYLLTLPSSKNIIFNRSSYEQEFWAIMRNQNLSDIDKQKLFNIIYFQRPLARGKISNCRLEKNRKVCHASNPLFQEFRCWRDANNIIIWDEELNEIEIPNETRITWAKKLLSGNKITKAQCCKDLGIKKSTSYTWLSGKALEGNPMVDIDNGLWQDLFSATDNEILGKLLSKKYGFDQFKIDQLLDFDLHKLDWSEYSLKSVRKLLPLLKEGYKLSTAILELYGEVDYSTLALRNVVVEKHYYAFESLVKMLKEKYPGVEIYFELDYLLKAGNKSRKALARNRRKKIKFEKENETTLKGLDSYNRLKFQLWAESEGISPYEPDYEIPLNELFTEEYDLDHIVPKSKLFETGRGNMVLCRKEINQKKGRKLAFEFATQDLGFSREEWIEIADKFESKKQYLLMEELPKDWVSKRQNSDYNTKCFSRLADVNIPNKLINKYQNEWSMRPYEEDDARYSLWRSLVIANMNQDTIEHFDEIENLKGAYNIKPTITADAEFDKVIPYMPKPKLVRKNKYGYYPSKQLHQETILGKREISGETFYKVRQPISKITPRMLKNIYTEDIRIAMEEWAESAGGLDKAKENLEEKPFIFRGDRVNAVSVKMTSTDLTFVRHKTMDKIHSKAKEGEPVDFVYNENNYALVTKTNEKGKLEKRLIPLMELVDGLNADNFKPIEGDMWRKNQLVMHNDEPHIFIGCGLDNAIRSVYDLSASPPIRVTAKMYQEMQKI